MTANKTGIQWRDKTHVRSCGQAWEFMNKHYSTAEYDVDYESMLQEADRLRKHIARLKQNIVKNTSKGKLTTAARLRADLEVKLYRLQEIGQQHYNGR